MSIPDPSPKSDQTNSPSTPSATSSQASADGQKHSNSQTCHPTPPSGQDHVPASRSAQPGSRKAPQTSATSGPSCETSSPSAALQQSLASKLVQKLEGRGSPLYDLKWKNWDMPSGPAICALRASVRRTSAKDSGSEQSGWPTPNVDDSKNSGLPTTSRADNARPFSMLPVTAQLAGWGTPSASDDRVYSEEAIKTWLNGETKNGHGLDLNLATQLAGPLRLTHTGELLTGSSAEMESGGQLNPEHSRWLMGYPEEWGFCGGTAMQSFPRSRRSSSKRSSNPPQL